MARLLVIMVEIRDELRKQLHMLEIPVEEIPLDFRCVFCMEDDKTLPILETVCKHCYHIDCMFKSIRCGNRVCAMCRSPIPPAWTRYDCMQITAHPGVITHATLILNTLYP
jgi:hypothetical protein